MRLAKKTVAHLFPKPIKAAKEWVDFISGRPTTKKLLVVVFFVFGAFALAGYLYHLSAVKLVQDASEEKVRVRDGTIGVQQNTLSTNAITIEGLRSDLQSVTRENTSLQRRYEDARQERDAAKMQLAPFLAAGNQYYSNIPSAERLDSLLAALTNSAADVKVLRDFQNRKAELSVTIVGEGAGWQNEAAPLTSNCIVYLPLFNGASNAGFHLILKNRGDLPAEVVHVSFLCPTQQVFSVSQGWEDQSSTALTLGLKKYLTKTDAIYPAGGIALNPLRFFNQFRTTSIHVSLWINARNAFRTTLPFEVFLFPAWTNIPPFVSTDHSAWKEFELLGQKN